MNVAIINPGTGAVAGAYLRVAWKNIRMFRRDVCPRAAIVRQPGYDSDGRYGFDLVLGGKVCRIKMPGLAWVDDPNIWNFPRLYVDGSSWAWSFAGGIVRDHLGLDQ